MKLTSWASALLVIFSLQVYASEPQSKDTSKASVELSPEEVVANFFHIALEQSKSETKSLNRFLPDSLEFEVDGKIGKLTEKGSREVVFSWSEGTSPLLSIHLYLENGVVRKARIYGPTPSDDFKKAYQHRYGSRAPTVAPAPMDWENLSYEKISNIVQKDKLNPSDIKSLNAYYEEVALLFNFLIEKNFSRVHSLETERFYGTNEQIDILNTKKFSQFTYHFLKAVAMGVALQWTMSFSESNPVPALLGTFFVLGASFETLSNIYQYIRDYWLIRKFDKNVSISKDIFMDSMRSINSSYDIKDYKDVEWKFQARLNRSVLFDKNTNNSCKIVFKLPED